MLHLGAKFNKGRSDRHSLSKVGSAQNLLKYYLKKKKVKMKKSLVSPSITTLQHGSKVQGGHFLPEKEVVMFFPGLGNLSLVVASRTASVPAYLVRLSLSPGLTSILPVALSLEGIRSRVPGEDRCGRELPAQREKQDSLTKPSVCAGRALGTSVLAPLFYGR